MPPREFRTPAGEALQRKLQAAVAEGFSRLPALTRDDMVLVGFYVQTYAHVEFQMRGCIAALAAMGALPDPFLREYEKLRPSRLVPAIKAAIGVRPTLVQDAVKACEILDEIELRREFRHLLAHWVARRIPGEDAVVFLTKDDGDYKKMHGRSIPNDEVGTLVMALPDLRGLPQHLGPYVRWLDGLAIDWHRLQTESSD